MGNEHEVRKVLLANLLANKIESDMVNTGSAMSARQSWIGTIQIITAAVCWGTLGIFSTYLNQIGFSGWQITILRIVTAAFLILIMLPKLCH